MLLFSAHNIQSLHLSGNQLTGCLSPGLLVNTNLTAVELSHNALTGQIPLSLQTTPFKTLDLGNNRFYGMLDDQLC
ncbi:hypothetical protein EON65_54775 [archaeon]|nr:MAG: hypothetical protein EON65_54775 [archaeon]